MNIFDMLHLTRLEIGLLLVVIALAAALILSKRSARSPERLEQAIAFEGLKEWIQESQAICETLSKNLQEKRKIAKRLLSQLDVRIEEMGGLLERAKESEPTASDEGKNKDLYPAIVEMADAGCHVAQIARWLRISEGEVQLVLDLKKFGRCEEPSRAGISRV